MCEALGVSETGYYRFVRAMAKPDKDELLSAEIKKVQDESPYNDNYGVPRMRLALEQRGIKVGFRRLKRIMREHGWLHEKKRRPHGITKADQEAMITENMIRQDFSAEKPFEKTLTDITQIQCMNGKLYVSPILDCFDGEILALRMADNMRKELCTTTLDSMVLRFPQTKGAILHSDRGSQYTSDAFRDLLERYEMKQSLSGVDHCYDNARMESFFATLKKELIYRLPVYRMTIDEVKAWIFQYVFGYYNRMRVTTFNPGGWPPSVYREMYMHTLAAA